MADREQVKWGVRHAGGHVTTETLPGRAFADRMAAEREAAKLDLGCHYCTGTHEAVCQTVTYGGWQVPGPMPLRLPQRGD